MSWASFFWSFQSLNHCLIRYKDEIGIEILPFKQLSYVPGWDRYVPTDEVPEGQETLSISGTKFRKMMNDGTPIPAWFSDPEVIRILQEVCTTLLVQLPDYSSPPALD